MKRLGDYECLEEIGRGGAGVVFRARSPRGGEVAVKLLAARDPERIARFERERRLVASFSEADGFVPLLDAGTTSAGPFLVMPFVPGGTLRERLRRGPLGVAETLALGLALARALGRAHGRGIVHRDLKPENVLFDARGRPLVADLGLAKHFDTGAAGASQSVALSRSGGIRGTAGYMAPEQMADAASVEPPTDVFALGAILYECLAGRPAFEGDTLLDLLAKVAHAKVTPLASFRSDVPASLSRAIDAALAKAPGARPRDGRALHDALSARPPRRGPLRALAAGGAVAVGALVALAGPPLLASSRRADIERRVATIRAKGDRRSLPDLREAARELDGIATDARRLFASERAASGRAALDAARWAEARDALLDGWLAAPERDAALDASLVAALLELAAEREAAGDAKLAATLRDQAASAGVPARSAAREALLARVKDAAAALVAAKSFAADDWEALVVPGDAARHASAASSLPDGADRALAAALVLSGHAEPSTLARFPAAAFEEPPLALASAKLYQDALAKPAGSPRDAALERLGEVPAPKEARAVAGEHFWQRGIASYGESRSRLAKDMTHVYEDLMQRQRGPKTEPGSDPMRLLLTALEPATLALGHALRVDPSREPFPVELGEPASLMRLIANQSDITDPADAQLWETLVAPLGDHPIACYARIMVIVHRDRKRFAAWTAERREEARALLCRALPVLERAPRTEHVRLLAHDLAAVFLDDSTPTAVRDRRAGGDEEGRRLAEISSYPTDWRLLARTYMLDGRPADERAAVERSEALVAAGAEEPPRRLVQLDPFLLDMAERLKGAEDR